jgi:hypothetical protein
LGFGICLATSACAKAQAKVAAEGPPLAVPDPPPRVLVPPEEEPLASAPPPETPPAPAPRAAARPPAPRPRAATTAPEPERTEPSPPPVAAQPTPEAPRELRPALSAADPAEEKKVRDVLQRAVRDLGLVDWRKLSSEGRAQYDQSKRFNDQAEQAIKERNYVYAATLADKAAALAAELLRGR